MFTYAHVKWFYGQSERLLFSRNTIVLNKISFKIFTSEIGKFSPFMLDRLITIIAKALFESQIFSRA